ncbi:MAG: polysaccharide pyruvyl transferase family protein [Glaciecola sp.]
MRLYYCEMPDGNIGDDLNEYIWPHYLPAPKKDSSHVVIGIGSLLNVNIPPAESYTVISAGVGYGDLPQIDNNWTFLAVRGEYSKSSLKLNKDVVLLDGAYLLKDCYEIPKVKEKKGIGYIPHVESLDYGDWERVCNLAGLVFIDPRLELNKFLPLLCSCEKVITEAMHGAIIADCYQIPWKPVKAYHHINTVKWDDWLSAFGETAHFESIKGVWGDIKVRKGQKLKNYVKRMIFCFYSGFNLTPPIYPKSSDSDYEMCANQLMKLAKANFYLNDEQTIIQKVEQLKSKISEHFFHTNKTSQKL